MFSIADLAHRRDPEAIATILNQEVQHLGMGEIKVEVEINDSNLDIQIKTNTAFDKDKLLTLLRGKLPTLRIKSVSKFRIHCWRKDEDIYEQRLMWTEQFMLDPRYSTITISPILSSDQATLTDELDSGSVGDSSENSHEQDQAVTISKAPQVKRAPESKLSKQSVLQQAIAQIMPDKANGSDGTAGYPDSTNRIDRFESAANSPSQPNLYTQSASIVKQADRTQSISDRNYWQLLLVGTAIIVLGLGIGASVRTITANINTAKDETPKPTSSLSTATPNKSEAMPTNSASANPIDNPISTPTQSPAEANVITLEKFNLIEKGMTLAQVEKILGTSGKVIAENVSNSTVGKVYSWKNPQGSNAIIEFKDGQVVAKAQAGL